MWQLVWQKDLQQNRLRPVWLYEIKSSLTVSSNINEVIRSVLNFFFFDDKILHAQKAQKE